jgi:C1A family cysteine protease
MVRKYPLVRSKKDERDYLLTLNLHPEVKIPVSVDLRSKCPPVFDQGAEGSCTGNAGVAARMMLNNIHTMLSRAFLYFEERNLEGSTDEDSGAQMRDICKALQKFGVCEEPFMPYVVGQYSTPPTKEAISNAVKYKIKNYKALSSLNQIKEYVATHQLPVLIGMEVYESMESAEVAKTGLLPMPADGEQLLGGHAVCCVGYDDSPIKGADIAGHLIIRNSWGSGWGQDGYFMMPYEYVNDKYSFDFWVLE